MLSQRYYRTVISSRVLINQLAVEYIGAEMAMHRLFSSCVRMQFNAFSMNVRLNVNVNSYREHKRLTSNALYALVPYEANINVYKLTLLKCIAVTAR